MFIGFLFLIVGAVVVLWLLSQLQSTPQAPSPNLRRMSRRGRNAYRKQETLKQANSAKKYRELVRLLNGDTKGADRLITQNQLMYKDRDVHWACEKAISDLERDRRR